MNNIAKRSRIAIILVGVLLAGLGVYFVTFLFRASDWMTTEGNPYVYSGTNVTSGIVLDRQGTVLQDSTNGRVYAESELLRKSTLHILGDRSGYINAPFLDSYADEVLGYNVLNGVYSTSDEPGTVRLTISGEVQKTALNALNGKAGVVAVYNYKTGEILCAVTSPTYDPDNKPSDVETNPAYSGVYVNRLTQSTYTPGSIFKVFTTAVALETIPGIEDMTFTCTGSYSFGYDQVTCEKAHGEVSLTKALQKSCNCAYAQIAMLLGADTLNEYAQKYSIMEPVTFDGVTTAKGSFDVSGTEDVNVAWGAIGQYTDTINPLRYLQFMGQIAGGGKGAVPYLVAEITSGGNRTYSAQTEQTSRILSTQAALQLQELMRANVVNIYGDYHFAGLTACAKSGTAQAGGGKAATATFAGFTTDEEYPLAFIVIVEEGGYGSDTCVPILSKVLTACKEAMDQK